MFDSSGLVELMRSGKKFSFLLKILSSHLNLNPLHTFFRLVNRSVVAVY